MPHYADGSLAQVGDKVKGKPYNTPTEVVGELIQITQNSEACNCVVAFVEVTAVAPEVVVAVQRVNPQAAFNGTQQCLLLPKFDYGETRAFTKLN